MPNLQATKRRTAAWRPLTVMLFVILAFGLLLPLRQLWEAWDVAHPVLEPGDGVFNPPLDSLDGWLPLAALITFLLWMATPLVAIATLVLAFNAVPVRGRVLGAWLAILGVLLAAWIVLPSVVSKLWLAPPDDGEPSFGWVPPSAGQYVLAALVQLLVLGAIAAIVLAVIGPRAFLSDAGAADQPAPAGWYLDPEAGQSWRWWDGAEWAPQQRS